MHTADLKETPRAARSKQGMRHNRGFRAKTKEEREKEISTSLVPPRAELTRRACPGVCLNPSSARKASTLHPHTQQKIKTVQNAASKPRISGWEERKWRKQAKNSKDSMCGKGGWGGGEEGTFSKHHVQPGRIGEKSIFLDESQSQCRGYILRCFQIIGSKYVSDCVSKEDYNC